MPPGESAIRGCHALSGAPPALLQPRLHRDPTEAAHVICTLLRAACLQPVLFTPDTGMRRRLRKRRNKRTTRCSGDGCRWRAQSETSKAMMAQPSSSWFARYAPHWALDGRCRLCPCSDCLPSLRASVCRLIALDPSALRLLLRFLPSHPIPSHPIPSHPIPPHPTPSHPIPSHPIPSHPIPSHPMPACRPPRFSSKLTLAV